MEKERYTLKLAIGEFLFGIICLIAQIISDIIRSIVNIIRESFYLITKSYKKYDYDKISCISLFTVGLCTCFDVNLNKETNEEDYDGIEIFNLDKDESRKVIDILKKNNVFKYKYDFTFRQLFSKWHLEETFHAFSYIDGGADDTRIIVKFTDGKEFRITNYSSKVYNYYDEAYEYCCSLFSEKHEEMRKRAEKENKTQNLISWIK